MEFANTPSPSAAEQARHRKVVMSCMMGTCIEWYDFFVYAVLAPLVFDKLFFPKIAPVIGTIAVFATFAVGYVARPVGGLVFGHYGDKIGRKKMLFLTLLIMGGSTTLIGLLPSYAAIGLWAPVLLVSLRFLQGFALGGESTGGWILTLESSPGNKRGFSVSLITATGALGMVIATGVTTLVTRLPEASLMSWGWRIPFLASIVLVALGTYIRAKVEESPVFAAQVAKKPVKVPLLELLRNHKKPTFIVFCAALLEASFFYIVGVFVIAFATKNLGVSKGTIINALLLANAVEFCLIPVFGKLSDRIGRRPVFAIGTLLAGLYVGFVYFGLMGTRDPMTVTIASVVGVGLIHAMLQAAEGTFVSELFEDARIRYSGVAFGKQFSAVVAGFTPMIATGLLAMNHGATGGISLYIGALCLISLIAIFSARETKGKSL